MAIKDFLGSFAGTIISDFRGLFEDQSDVRMFQSPKTSEDTGSNPVRGVSRANATNGPEKQKSFSVCRSGRIF